MNLLTFNLLFWEHFYILITNNNPNQSLIFVFRHWHFSGQLNTAFITILLFFTFNCADILKEHQQFLIKMQTSLKSNSDFVMEVFENFSTHAASTNGPIELILARCQKLLTLVGTATVAVGESEIIIRN